MTRYRRLRFASGGLGDELISNVFTHICDVGREWNRRDHNDIRVSGPIPLPFGGRLKRFRVLFCLANSNPVNIMHINGFTVHDYRLTLPIRLEDSLP